MARIEHSENSLLQFCKIDHITIYPNVEDTSFNTCLMVCRDQNDNAFLSYCPKLGKEINLAVLTKEIEEWFRTYEVERDYEFQLKLLPIGNEKVVFKIFTLEEKVKDMTKLEIEEELGYKINIVK